LAGLQYTPGRKLAIFLSERLRAGDRVPDPTWVSRLINSANRGSTVLYAVDVASNADPAYVLEQGLAGVAPQTGGAFFDAAGDPGAALTRIVESQQGYYILGFETEPMQRITPLVVKPQRPGVQVRARNGTLGVAGEGDGAGFVAPGDELRTALGSALSATGLQLGLRLQPGTSAAPSLEAVLHLNANEVTLALRPDGKYHGELEATAALFQENDSPVSQENRLVTLQLTPEERLKAMNTGFAFAVPLPSPKKGPYQLRAAVLDDSGGRLGAASVFFELRDVKLPPLTMAPIQLEPAGDSPHAAYPPDQPVRYSYELANLRNDGANHAKVEVTNRLMLDGRVIYTGEPKIIDIGLTPQQSSARISGTVKLGGQVQPGKFALTITALDTLATGAERRSASQTIEFEIRH
jgi:hypothetical protein